MVNGYRKYDITNSLLCNNILNGVLYTTVKFDKGFKND